MVNMFMHKQVALAFCNVSWIGLFLYLSFQCKNLGQHDFLKVAFNGRNVHEIDINKP